MQQRFYIVLLLFLPLLAVGQTEVADTTTQEEVQVDHADVFEYSTESGAVQQRLIGHVELSQDSVYMYCDTAVIERRNQVFAEGNVIIQQGDSITAFSDSLQYDGDLRIADLYGEVVLLNGEQSLFTNRLNYDLNTKIASYFAGATLTNGSAQLTSKRGYYYVADEVAYFKDSVVVVDTNFVLRADTLQFNTATKIVDFLGPTLIKNDTIKVYCEDGFYDTENNIAEFRQNAQFEKNNQQAQGDIIRYDGSKGEYLLVGNAQFNEEDKVAYADTIRYDEVNDLTVLIGNAIYEDKDQNITSDEIIYNAKTETYSTKGRSLIVDPPQILEADKIDYSDVTGMGLATGNVYWQDTSANMSIICNTADYNQETDYLKATGGPKGRPMLISLMEEDSLFLAADTLLSLRLDTLESDSNRALIAYNDVRLFKSDLQAICDSLVYNSRDSLFRFFNDPVMWSDTSQFSADTLSMILKDEKIDKVILTNNGLIINSPDEIYFNQIKGRFITAKFWDDNLREMDVEGNAESVYYALDEEKAYVGVNKTICSEMTLYFGDNQIEKIKFFSEPKANLLPMNQTQHEEIKLKGFFWEKISRPQSIEDLFGPKVKSSRPEVSPAAEMLKTRPRRKPAERPSRNQR